MALNGFPAVLPDNIYSVRFHFKGTVTVNFADNEFIFTLPADALLSQPLQRQAWSNYLRVKAYGSDVQFSFDGTTVHGLVEAGNDITFELRHEGGVAVRTVGGSDTALVEAW